MLYSYVITRDYGFAPNPFGKHCTLATCKPRIRKAVKVGDWVVGTGSNAKTSTVKKRLIFAMEIEEILGYKQYWNDARFKYKKPVMNGSKKQKYGDNIYYFDSSIGEFKQLNSHHSLDNGSTNELNLKRDLSGKNVLISSNFWYFGEKAPKIPNEFKTDIVKDGIGYKIVTDQSIIDSFIFWLKENYESGYRGMPCLFKGKYNRYNGK